MEKGLTENVVQPKSAKIVCKTFLTDTDLKSRKKKIGGKKLLFFSKDVKFQKLKKKQKKCLFLGGHPFCKCNC